jgi:hypothetical protein
MGLTNDQMELLADRIAELDGGYDPGVSVYENYSGRAMYGEKVPALVFEGPVGPVLAMMAWAACEMREKAEAGVGALEEWADVEVGDLPTRIDSMGRGTVIY